MSTFHHVSIDYDEDVRGSYRAVVLKGPDGSRRWATGDPQADWAGYLDHAISERLTVLETSSVTHFCFDNIEWRFVLDARAREVLVPEDRPEWLAEIAKETPQ